MGTAIAPALGALFILQDKVKTTSEIEELDTAARKSYYITEASAVQIPFLGIAVFITIIAVVFLFVNLPKVGAKETSNDYSKVLKNRNLVLGAIALFCYVGAEVALGSYMVNYFLSLDLAPVVREVTAMRWIAEWILSVGVSASSDMAVVGVFVTFYWMGAMIGRFIGSYLTTVFNPARVLSIFAVGAIGMILISTFSVGLAAMWAIIAVGLFNSIMFPTIFSLALDGLGDDKAQGSGILCTMIVGGAVIPPAYGYLTDSYNFNIALILVIVCYVYIFYYAYTNKKRKVAVA